MKSFLIKSILIMFIASQAVAVYSADSATPPSYWSSFLRGAANCVSYCKQKMSSSSPKLNLLVTCISLLGICACIAKIRANNVKADKLRRRDELYSALSSGGPFAEVEAILNRIPNLDPVTDNRALLLAIDRYGEQEARQLVDMMLNRQLSPTTDALKLALQKEYFDVAKHLLNKGALMEDYLLLAMIAGKKYKSIEFLLKCGVDVNKQIQVRGAGTVTPLGFAVTIDECMVTYLLEHGAISTINTLFARQIGDSGTSPLIQAGFSNKIETMKLLLSRGANINLQNQGGVTVLMSEAGQGHIQTVKFLLSQNADVDLKDNNGCTALDYAQEAIDGSEELKRILESRIIHRTAQNGISNAEHEAIVQKLSPAEQQEIEQLRFFEPGQATGALNGLVADYLSGEDVDKEIKLEIAKRTEIQEAEEQSKEDAEQNHTLLQWQDILRHVAQ